MNSKVSFGAAAVAALRGMPLLRTRPAPVWTRAGATDGTVGGDELSFTQRHSPVIIFVVTLEKNFFFGHRSSTSSSWVLLALLVAVALSKLRFS